MTSRLPFPAALTGLAARLGWPRARPLPEDWRAAAKDVFAGAWYAASLAGELEDGTDPFDHFVTAGWAAGLPPNPVFDPAWYGARNPDITAAKADPLIHYLASGAAEKRDPGPHFSVRDYVRAYPDAGREGVNPLADFLARCSAQGMAPDPAGYRQLLEKAATRQRKALRAALRPETLGSTYARRLTELAGRHLPKSLPPLITASETALAEARVRLTGRAGRPLVSIIVHANAPAPLLADTLASVLEQDYCNFELLVCEAAGNPETTGILGGFPDARLRHLPVEAGSSTAVRNHALDEARGEIIAHLAAGNVWHPSALSRAVLALEEMPGHLWAYAGSLTYTAEPDGGCTIHAFTQPEFDAGRLASFRFIDLDAVFYRRALHAALGGFDEAARSHAGHELMTRLALSAPPAVLGALPVICRHEAGTPQGRSKRRRDGGGPGLPDDIREAVNRRAGAIHAALPATVPEPETEAEPAQAPVLSRHAGLLGDAEEDGAIILVDRDRLDGLSIRPRAGNGAIMPVFDGRISEAVTTARLLVNRAGAKLTVIVVVCESSDSYVPVINATARRLDARHIVYTGANVFPGMDWLKTGLKTLKREGAGLLAFHDGRWAPGLAASGLVSMPWVKPLHDGLLFHPGYEGRGADVDLTAMAKLSNRFAFDPDALLMTLDGQTALRTGYSSKERRKQERALLAARFPRGAALTADPQASLPDAGKWMDHVDIVRVADLSGWRFEDKAGSVAVLPTLDREAALQTAREMITLAGAPLRVLIALDEERKGFIHAVNTAARQITAQYIIYAAQDARAGLNWLSHARTAMRESSGGLLAFNDGKWRGRLAGFGMVRTSWVKGLYGGAVFHNGYHSHRADNELTVIARAQGRFVYCPEAVLLEQDAGKALRRSERSAGNFTRDDRQLFETRYDAAFDGLAPRPALKKLRPEYFGHHRKFSLK